MPALIDPPEGWRYGFPKPVPDGADRKEFLAGLADWLVQNGYPQEMIERHNAANYSRVIGEFDGK